MGNSFFSIRYVFVWLRQFVSSLLISSTYTYTNKNAYFCTLIYGISYGLRQ